MSSQLEILGPESSVLYYNLNKQFCTNKKLIITKEIVLDSFENQKVRELFNSLKMCDVETYNDTLRELDLASAFDSSMKNDFYNKVQDTLNRLYDQFSDVKLKDYNFMNAVSNIRLTITLRCPNFSISRHYIEKGAVLNTIKSLLKDYLQYEGNSYRGSKLDSFQIEICNSEEIYKHLFLKKDGSSLILSSSFGYMKWVPFDHSLGPEIYYSNGDSFNLFPNRQKSAIVREHNKVEESEINTQEKVLLNDELVKINEMTRNINDALIEIIINKKGNIKIHNVSLLENSISVGNDNGFMINKSSKNYNRVSLITLRDNLEEELSNPKYLLIRNQEEVFELLNQVKILRSVDGVVFTSNFYSPFLDRLGAYLDIDIVYYKNELQKSLDAKVDFENLSIEGAKQNSSSNPFSNIINENNKEKDEFLERLKNLDLSSPVKGEHQENRNAVSSLAQGLISSPGSSTATSGSRGNNTMSMYNSSGSKKSAIEMLAASVINNGEKPVREENRPQPESQPAQNNDYMDFSSAVSQESATAKPSSQDIRSSVFSDEDNIEKERYDGVLATTLITKPNIRSGNYFVDANSIGEAHGGNIFYFLSDREELGNKSLNYIMPIHLMENDEAENVNILINSTSEFFMAKKPGKYFINLTQISQDIKGEFLRKCINDLGVISLIISKTDVQYLQENISMIDKVFIRDLTSSEELNECKNTILSFEKKYLMRN